MPLLWLSAWNRGVDGARVERVLELCGVASNKKTVSGDKAALKPGGLRLGTPAMTSRGFQPEEVKMGEPPGALVAETLRYSRPSDVWTMDPTERLRGSQSSTSLLRGRDDRRGVPARHKVAGPLFSAITVPAVGTSADMIATKTWRGISRC
ncbi:serine hydroxymethyltransferase-domain-containing protein [Penicillium bovifimosum]|uniref:Glycine hydroxymethyltransferase n=1 Tax=Penicillium bovifimosum TaxID=126998 RepID=A0A9W9HBQ3_9EURO|nr:serine hydroxymethyltransferase-domain-containing protein [Penicillium bovifimosum]KAJ5143692.1 serine hydroxymethyltransferase-domain-containing protein [Penicillium bovifimosum]